MWASSCEIYDKISPAYRKFLEGLTARFSQTRLPRVAADKGFELYTEPRGSPNNVGDSLTAVHPVVRTNPVTGWKSLFAVGNHVESVNDVTPDESKRLLDWFLQLIVEEHDCQLRHRWKNPYDLGAYSSSIWLTRVVHLIITTQLSGITAPFTILLFSILLGLAHVQAFVRLESARARTSTRAARLAARHWRKSKPDLVIIIVKCDPLCKLIKMIVNCITITMQTFVASSGFTSMDALS
jgi:hypothetical protein